MTYHAVATTKKNEPTTTVTINRKAVIFWIGGAGDKKMYAFSGPNKNIVYAQQKFIARKNNELISKINAIKEEYLGYYEIYETDDIKKNVIDKIAKDDLVYIIGHSLGGWNGAYITRKLAEKGITTTMLITLDPVGVGAGVAIVSNIFWKTPKVRANKWINVGCSGKSYDFSDFVADLGSQWRPVSGPTVNAKVDLYHLDADLIFTAPIQDGKSALDFLIESLRSDL
ncbi:hypothetical protein [Hydromonas duriensis]|uniref:Alpha/beta hydrolase family protein n=1 Tax=Hydromonas duriensis TaxID=1527608 RepID=A0A4R6Y3L3_9BURK|nr:hypothetical protein [Hydromonas duriensis]TDR26461.1 hypothetical protein DFR44_1612 [Hydromonas duriensis]